jgi:hypothetical protein
MVMNLSTAYIGLINPKSPDNVGMVLRAAGCYEAKQIFYTGDRLARARRFRTDTKNAQAKIPLTYADDFFNIDFATQGTQFVAVELICPSRKRILYFWSRGRHHRKANYRALCSNHLYSNHWLHEFSRCSQCGAL